MRERVKRSYVLTAGMVIQFCAGIIYMWSVFRGPVVEYLNWEAGPAGYTSSIMLAMFVLGIILGGRAQDVYGPKRVTIVGSILISVGMLLTALVRAGAPWLIYITYSILGGLGVGTVYTATVSVVQKWFPDKRGFASGMIVSAFGVSLVVFSPLAKLMLENWGVPTTFLAFGIGFLVVCTACSLLVDNPPAGYAPKGYSAPGTGAAPTQKQYTTGEMLKTKQYYILTGAMLFTLPAYFILNPLLMELGEARGLDNIAVVGVMITGIGSAAGRLIISWVSDKIGRKPAMHAIAILVLAATLGTIVAEGVLFLICIALVSFGFGGSASVYAASTAELFGTEHMGMNFGMVMLGFMISALVFPMISSAVSSGGDYTVAFIIAAATCVVAIVLVALLKEPEQGKNKQ